MLKINLEGGRVRSTPYGGPQVPTFIQRPGVRTFDKGWHLWATIWRRPDPSKSKIMSQMTSRQAISK